MYSNHLPPEGPSSPLEFPRVICAANTPQTAAKTPQCVADTLCSAAGTLHSAANAWCSWQIARCIQPSLTATFTAFTTFLANFENLKYFQLFFEQKNIFFKKCSKNGLVSKKYFYHFLGGVKSQSDHFFKPSPTVLNSISFL